MADQQTICTSQEQNVFTMSHTEYKKYYNS